MKPLAIFVVGVAVVFGGFALAVNVFRSTDKVFVVVDSSFPMTEVWDQVPGALNDIEDASYSEFALATEKSLVHSWQDSLELTATNPFAPCTFEQINGHAEVGEATELILITTASSCPTDQLDGWRITRLSP